MNKREVLENLVYNGTSIYNEISKEQIDQALTELDKLEKEKMLEIVGDGEPQFLHKDKIKEGIAWCDGRQQLRAEIRKKINLQRGLR